MKYTLRYLNHLAFKLKRVVVVLCSSLAVFKIRSWVLLPRKTGPRIVWTTKGPAVKSEPLISSNYLHNAASNAFAIRRKRSSPRRERFRWGKKRASRPPERKFTHEFKHTNKTRVTFSLCLSSVVAEILRGIVISSLRWFGVSGVRVLIAA